VYTYGETVIFIITKPEEGLGGCGAPFLTVSLPDGSTVKINLPYDTMIPAGTYSIAVGQAGPPPGARLAQLWLAAPCDVPIGPHVEASTTYYVQGGEADIFVANCWANPANPYQEDRVTFYAAVGNIGGSDAPNVEIDAYLDGNLFQSERDTISAGSSGTWYSDNAWTAQDGSHTLRVVANADHSVQESNYGNNEASCTFFVSPRTITATFTITTTSTRVQSQWTTTTMGIQQTTTKTLTTQSTVQSTVSANPVWTTTTLTGLTTTTVYSPTTTITTTVAQAISNPFIWLIGLSIIGGVAASRETAPSGEWLGKLSYEVMKMIKGIRSARMRKVITAVLLIAVGLLSIASTGIRQGYASTVTMTRTSTVTYYSTITQSLTSTRYMTYTATETSTSTMRSTAYTTVTPTATTTIDQRSTARVYVPTTTYTTQQLVPVSIEISVLDACGGNQVSEVVKGRIYCLKILVKNPSATAVDISLHATLRFNGDPNQVVASDGITWRLGAQPDSIEQDSRFNVPPGGSAPLQRPVVFTWNWIPPADMEEISKELLLNTVLKTINIIVSAAGLPGLLDLLASPFHAADLTTKAAFVLAKHTYAKRYVYEVSGKLSQTGQTLSASRVLDIGVSGEATASFIGAIVLGILGIVATLVALAFGCLATGCTASAFLAMVAAAVLGWAVWTAGKTLYIAATDPDDNYEQTPTPRLVIPPLVQEMPDGAEKNLALSSLRFYSLLDAFSTAMTRHYAALEHNAMDAAIRQLTTAEDYLSQAQSEIQKVRESYGLVKDRLPQLDQTALDRAMTYLRGQRLPEQAHRVFDQLGEKYFPGNLLIFAQNATQVIPAMQIEKVLDGATETINHQRNLLQEVASGLRQAGTGVDIVPYVYVAIPVALAIVAFLLFRRRPSFVGQRISKIYSDSISDQLMRL